MPHLRLERLGIRRIEHWYISLCERLYDRDTKGNGSITDERKKVFWSFQRSPDVPISNANRSIPMANPIPGIANPPIS